MGTILRVTELEVLDVPNAVVRPGALLDIVARTEDVEVQGPDNLQIEWSGDLGVDPKINGGSLNTRFVQVGAHTVTAKGAAGGNSVTVRVWRSEASVAQGGEFAITDEPQMPVITAQLQIIGPVTATINDWTCDVEFVGADDCRNIPNFGVINDDLKVVQAGGDQFTPSFDKVRGRSVTFTVSFTVEGELNEEFAFATIKGTNPQRSDVQRELGDPRDAELKAFAKHYKSVLSRIACRESGQRQFDAEADGGVSGCPVYSSDRRGRVGIMQIPDPTPDQIWNWKENVIAGIKKFQKSVAAAEGYPNEVMESRGFQDLVGDFNKRRQQQGLKLVDDVVLLPFKVGDFNNEDDPVLGQHELDAIRGYDDSTDPDRFGLKLHEYRVVVDLIDGEEVLRVTNITATDEGTLQGEAVWEQVPVADRHTGRPNYVEEVLSFLFDCTPVAVPCNLTGISPATQTLFVGSKPFRFTAEGTGLGRVTWTADGGSPESGTGATFETKWSTTGQKTVTASCGGTPQTATVVVLDVEIQINNTESTNDDVVQVKCNHPPRTFKVPCRIKVKGPAAGPVNVILKNLDSRLTFPPDLFVKDIELPANGNWKDFEIAGEKASRKIGDAKIIVQDAVGSGDDVAEQKVSVQFRPGSDFG
jgi:hypothetical protein